MDLYNNLREVLLLVPQTINNTDTNTNILDTRGFERAALSVAVGDCTGLDADSTLELILQESDTTTGTDFTNVAVVDMIRSTTGLSSTSTAGLFGTLNLNTEDQAIYRVEYLGTKRYIRANLDFTTGTGGITAAPVSVTGFLASARHAPADAPSPIAAL